MRRQRVAAIPIREALDNFLEWLKKFSDVVLVAHNGRVFDFRVLCSAVNKCNLQNTFRETVTAFVDSLSVMKKTFQSFRVTSRSALHDILVYQTIMHIMQLMTSLC